MRGLGSESSWVLLLSAATLGVNVAGVDLRPLPRAHLQIRSGADDEAWRSTQARKHWGNLFRILLREWEAVPEKEAFVKNCTETISKLVPVLRREYTSNNVPTVIYHECDVYATAEDFATTNITQLEQIRSSCRGNARRLGSEFLGAQDYKAWCSEVHQNLEEQATLDRVKAEREALSNERARIKAELDDLHRQLRNAQAAHENHAVQPNVSQRSQDNLTETEGMNGISFAAQCCPSGCRVCGWVPVPPRSLLRAEVAPSNRSRVIGKL